MADKLDDKSFLQRWSARKTEARDGEDVDTMETQDGLVVEQSAVADTDPDTEVPDISDQPPPDLPDVETLNADSDYTGFLGENVPADVAKMALRKLWRSDPVLANVDGLNDYDEDFSKVGMVSEVVKTAYRIGKGYLTDAEIEGAAAEDGEDVEVDAERMSEEAPDNASEEVSDIVADIVDEEENEQVEFHNAELAKSV